MAFDHLSKQNKMSFLEADKHTLNCNVSSLHIHIVMSTCYLQGCEGAYITRMEVNIELCDYPSNKRTLLKWGEVHAIQLFVEHQRGDWRPPIILKERM